MFSLARFNEFTKYMVDVDAAVAYIRHVHRLERDIVSVVSTEVEAKVHKEAYNNWIAAHTAMHTVNANGEALFDRVVKKLALSDAQDKLGDVVMAKHVLIKEHQVILDNMVSARDVLRAFLRHATASDRYKAYLTPEVADEVYSAIAYVADFIETCSM